MRLNKNFANVYTPFHEFDCLTTDEDIDERKRKRIQNRRLRFDGQLNKNIESFLASNQ